MYLGKIMELATYDELFANPLHPYTQSLMSAVPIPDPPIERARARIILQGDIPSPVEPPGGCVFSSRCPFATDVCHSHEPAMRNMPGGHLVACHHIDDPVVGPRIRSSRDRIVSGLKEAVHSGPDRLFQ
jgi:oligopeptide/dipeptide ABC transporter ATP-binding protein